MTTEFVVYLIGISLFIGLLLIIFIAALRKKGRSHSEVRRDLRGLAKPHFQKDALIAISVPVATALNFFLQAETDRTRTLRKQGRLTEQQTGISAFDAQIFLECDDPKLAQWLAADEPARTLVLQLVSAGRSLELSGCTLKLNRPDSTPHRLGTLAANLKALAQQVPRVNLLHPLAQAMDGRVLLLRLFAGALLVLALGAGVQLMLEIDQSPFPQHATVWPLLLTAGMVGAALGWLLHRWCIGTLRSSSRVPRMAAELVLTLWLPVVALTMLGTRYANLHGHAGAGSEAVVRLDRLYSKRHRRSSSHHLALGPIEAAGLRAQSWRSSAWLNQRLAGAENVRVHWRRGWLGSVIIMDLPEAVGPAKPVAGQR